MKDLRFNPVGPRACHALRDAADAQAADLVRLAVLLEGIQALASGGSTSAADLDPLELVEALASLMLSRVEVMRSRVEVWPCGRT